jgi:hypothetical protein
MPWGKHRGKELSEVPECYCRWALENASSLDGPLREAIRQRLGLLPQQQQSDQTAQLVETVRTALRDIHRAMALRFHPDRGGSTQAMAAINHMNDCLQESLSRRLPKPKE